MRRPIHLLLLTFVALIFAMPTVAQEDTGFRLTLVHTNDTRSAHEPNAQGNGGASRLAAVVKQIRAQNENMLVLDAGDRFTGSLFYTQFLGLDQVEIMSAIGYDAMVPGNHEFDGGDQILADFASQVPFPLVAANIQATVASPLFGLIKPYVVIEVGGQQIGVIGVVRADTPQTSNPSAGLRFEPNYAASANAAAAELGAQGVNKIILLSHIGLEADQTMITELQNIDVVIGANSQSLLSNTLQGATGDYPLVFETTSGDTVYYGQSGANTVYFGQMDLEFDADGVVTSASGDTYLLSRFITPDPDVESIVTELAQQIDLIRQLPLNVVVETPLVGDRNVCRVEECNLGNLLADAIRADTGVQIALVNSGSIRANIDTGEVTLGEVLTVQPFTNQVSTFSLQAADIIAMLENSVSGIRVVDGVIQREGLPGRFLQVSGLRYTYDPTRPVGQRVLLVEVQDAVGLYQPLSPTATYTVAANNFLRAGGDGYTMLEQNAIDPYDFGRVDYEVTAEYMQRISPVSYAVEGRIVIEGATLAPLP